MLPQIRHPDAKSTLAEFKQASDDTADEVDRALDQLFGPVVRWWVGELPGLGVMRLPLP